MIEAGPRFFVDFAAVTLAALTAGMILEMLAPARHVVISVGRWLNNAGLALITYSCNHLVGTLAAASILYMSEASPFPGLANVPLWLDVSVTVLALELTRYGTHVAMHKLPLLWRFHAVHHTDSAVDVSTAFRHHPIEALVAAVPLTAVVWLLGGAPEALIIYRAWDLIMAVMTHSNVEVPSRLERWLKHVVVTPGFHRTHHLAEQRYTDSNYSASVPWFDYLFSTYQSVPAEQQKLAKIGLDTHTPNEQRLDGMLRAPFVERLKDAK